MDYGIIQNECLKSRELLFKDPVLGYDYSFAGVRGNVSVDLEESRINSMTNNEVQFTFISHRHLLINIAGADEIISLHASNQYGSFTNLNDKDSKSNNPYLKIQEVLEKYFINNQNLNNMKKQTKTIDAQGIQDEVISAVEKYQKGEKLEDVNRILSNKLLNMTGGKINILLFPKGNSIKADFKSCDLFNKIHLKGCPGKYSINKVAELVRKIISTEGHSMDDHASCTNLEQKSFEPEMIHSNVSENLIDLLTAYSTAHLQPDSIINKLMEVKKTNLSSSIRELTNGIITCELKDEVIVLEVAENRIEVSIQSKSFDVIQRQVKEAIKQLIICASIYSSTRERMLEIVPEKSIINLLAS